MPTRITQSMMNSQMLRNMNGSMTRLNNLQNQMATSRKINKPSDDAVGITYAMRYRSELSANEQYEKNVDSAISWLDFTDSMLNQAGSVLQRIRELTVNAANGTNPQDAMRAVKSEVEQLAGQMAEIGNSQFNGKYVFNGELTDLPPYPSDALETAATDSGKIEFEIGTGVKIRVNVSGNEVFGGPGQNVFGVLKELSASLTDGDHSNVSAMIGKLDAQIGKLLNVRADLGAKTNRIELAQDRLGDISINLQTLQSKTEDADMAELITNLKTEENVYQSALSVGAKIIRPSLIDFLR